MKIDLMVIEDLFLAEDRYWLSSFYFLFCMISIRLTEHYLLKCKQLEEIVVYLLLIAKKSCDAATINY